MTQEPLVSIIIPTYNCRRWLGEAIDSALRQTYPHCEVIVVDDGSTDGTGELVRTCYGEQVRYFWQENQGVAQARNQGMAEARGDYLQFLDADDLLLPEKIATHVHFLEAHPEYGVVYCDVLQFLEDDRGHTWPWPRLHRFRSGNILDGIVDSDYLLPHMLLVRRSWADVVGPFDHTLPSNEDWDWFLRLAVAGARFYFLDGEPMALYRCHRTSRSHRHVQHGLSGIMVLHKLERAIPDPDERRRLGIRQAIGNWQFAYGRALCEDGQLIRGWVQMLLSLWNDRRSLHYKLSYMLGVPILGPVRTPQVQTRVQSLLHPLRRVKSGVQEDE